MLSQPVVDRYTYDRQGDFVDGLFAIEHATLDIEILAGTVYHKNAPDESELCIRARNRATNQIVFDNMVIPQAPVNNNLSNTGLVQLLKLNKNEFVAVCKSLNTGMNKYVIRLVKFDNMGNVLLDVFHGDYFTYSNIVPTAAYYDSNIDRIVVAELNWLGSTSANLKSTSCKLVFQEFEITQFYKSNSGTVTFVPQNYRWTYVTEIDRHNGVYYFVGGLMDANGILHPSVGSVNSGSFNSCWITAFNQLTGYIADFERCFDAQGNKTDSILLGINISPENTYMLVHCAYYPFHNINPSKSFIYVINGQYGNQTPTTLMSVDAHKGSLQGQTSISDYIISSFNYQEDQGVSNTIGVTPSPNMHNFTMTHQHFQSLHSSQNVIQANSRAFNTTFGSSLPNLSISDLGENYYFRHHPNWHNEYNLFTPNIAIVNRGVGSAVQTAHEVSTTSLSINPSWDWILNQSIESFDFSGQFPCNTNVIFDAYYQQVNLAPSSPINLFSGALYDEQAWNSTNLEPLNSTLLTCYYHGRYLAEKSSIEGEDYTKIKFDGNKTISIEAYRSRDVIESVELYDLLGRPILLSENQLEFHLGINNYNLEVLSDLPHGIYIVNLSSGEENRSYKIMK